MIGIHLGELVFLEEKNKNTKHFLDVGEWLDLFAWAMECSWFQLKCKRF